MGPIPRRSFIVERLPLKPADRLTHQLSALIRRLPPRAIRFLIFFDLLFCFMPFWAWFLYRRWTGIALSAKEASLLYREGMRFGFTHLWHTSEGTGAFSVDWGSRPIRHAAARERADYAPKGSCGTCKNCCTTHWLPPEQRKSCPMLGPDGCRVYGGLYWDLFNCGRYPFVPRDTLSYACPRFEGPVTIPDVLPDHIGRDVTVPSRSS